MMSFEIQCNKISGFLARHMAFVNICIFPLYSNCAVESTFIFAKLSYSFYGMESFINRMVGRQNHHRRRQKETSKWKRLGHQMMNGKAI